MAALPYPVQYMASLKFLAHLSTVGDEQFYTVHQIQYDRIKYFHVDLFLQLKHF